MSSNILKYKFFDMPNWAESLLHQEEWFDRFCAIIDGQPEISVRNRFQTALQCGVDFTKISNGYLHVVSNELWVYIEETPEVTLAILSE